MPETIEIELTVNGARLRRTVEARQHLADFLREVLQLTGTHLGCEHGVCGACTVRVDGAIARSCLMLAAQADGAVVETIEGLSDSGALRELQESFIRHNAAQCGYCTPGMLITAHALLKDGAPRSRQEIREYLSGNVCRCTGYQAIVDAVESAMKSGRSA